MTEQGKKKRTHIFDFHLCSKCCRMIDIETEPFVRYTDKRVDKKKGVVRYHHQVCPTLQEKYDGENEP